MKEAAGEANMTVVTIILIGVIVAVATPIVKSMMNTTKKKACCMDNGGVWDASGCKSVESDGSLGSEPKGYSACIGDTTAEG